MLLRELSSALVLALEAAQLQEYMLIQLFSSVCYHAHIFVANSVTPKVYQYSLQDALICSLFDIIEISTVEAAL